MGATWSRDALARCLDEAQETNVNARTDALDNGGSARHGSHLEELPPEIVAELQLPLAALSSLACASRVMGDRIPPDAWCPALELRVRSLLRTLNRLPHTDTAAAQRMGMNATAQPAVLGLHPAGQAHDEDVQLLRLARSTLAMLAPDVAFGALRASSRRLREQLCCLCESRGADGRYFPLLGRGACSTCLIDRAAEARRWARQAAAREAALRVAADARTGARLLEALGEALRERGGGIGADAGAGREPELLFDSSRDGSSLTALLRAADAAAAGTVLLVTERSAGVDARCFGAFVPEWSARRSRGFFGDERCFLFALGPTTVYPARACGAEGGFVHASGQHGVGFGGTLPAGGQPLFGLHLHADLLGGRCMPCRTYGECAALPPTFEVSSVQLWALVGEEGGSARREQSWEQREAKAQGVLEPGQDKIMLEFIGIERGAAMQKRFA